MKNNIKKTLFLLVTAISAGTVMLNAMQEEQPPIWVIIDGKKQACWPDIQNLEFVRKQISHNKGTNDNPIKLPFHISKDDLNDLGYFKGVSVSKMGTKRSSNTLLRLEHIAHQLKETELAAKFHQGLIWELGYENES